MMETLRIVLDKISGEGKYCLSAVGYSIDAQGHTYSLILPSPGQMLPTKPHAWASNADASSCSTQFPEQAFMPAHVSYRPQGISPFRPKMDNGPILIKRKNSSQ